MGFPVFLCVVIGLPFLLLGFLDDKFIWAVTLLFFAPVGFWLFRAYRQAHWPQVENEPRADSRPLATGNAMPEPT
jgi:hypothetical protein